MIEVPNYSFSERSQFNLATCAVPLQTLFWEVIKHWDCGVICGHRDEKAQNEAFIKGATKLHFPDSKHNTYLSRAVDVFPCPLDWDDIPRWRDFGFFVMGVAAAKNINIRWGADWNKNYSTEDERFKDFPHFELIG